MCKSDIKIQLTKRFTASKIEERSPIYTDLLYVMKDISSYCNSSLPVKSLGIEPLPCQELDVVKRKSF